MKFNQSFLYGLGTGLIAASIVFGINQLTNPPALTPKANPISNPATVQTPTPPPNSDGKPENKPKTVSVTILEGTPADQIAELLKQKGVISDPVVFLNAAGDQVKKIRIGTYELPINGDASQILQIITSGKS